MNSSPPIGLNIEWGGSGAQDIGADRFTAYTPTFYFGKGLGDIPVSMDPAFRHHRPGRLCDPEFEFHRDRRPRQRRCRHRINPRVLVWGASLQYSMPYLKFAVVDLGLPDFFNRLIPLVEASLQTPVANTVSSGT